MTIFILALGVGSVCYAIASRDSHTNATADYA